MGTPNAEIEERLASAAAAMAGLSLDEQRRLIIYLLRQLDAQAPDPDHFTAMLLALGTDIRQRVALNKW